MTGLYLLLVENSYISPREIKALFTANNIVCEIVSISSSKLLIDLAQKLIPELIIVDLEYFTTDPISVTKALRHRAPHVYIIAFTGPEYYQDLGRAIDAGVNDYLMKPPQREDVLLRIKMGLNRLYASRNEADLQEKAYRAAANEAKAIIGDRANRSSAIAPEPKLYNNPRKVGYIGKEREMKAVKETDSGLAARYHEIRDKDYLAEGDEAVSPFYREIRLTPAKGMRKGYERIQNEGDGPEIDLNVIQDKLNGKELPAGALFCDADQFRYFYKLEQLRSERSGQSVLLCMLAFSSKDYSRPPGYLLPEVMLNLKNVLTQTLRKGDLFTNWHEGQVLLLLPGLNREQAAELLDRIDRAYSRTYSLQGLILQKKIETIFPLEGDSHFN